MKRHTPQRIKQINKKDSLHSTANNFSRKWQPTAAFLPGKSHGQWSPVDYSLPGRSKSQTQLSEYARTGNCIQYFVIT